MATRLQQRRGTAAEWAASNEVLADGQIGIETDNYQVKVGNGVLTWNELSYSTMSPILFDALGDLLVGSGNNTVSKLPIGTAGQRLTVKDDGTLGWVDLPPSAANIPLSTVIANGDLVVGSGVGAVLRLPRGATNQHLTVQANGTLAWTDLPIPSADIPLSTVTAAEDLIVGAGAGVVKRLGKGTDGKVLTIVGGVLTWVTPSADVPLSTITAAEDLIVGAGAGAVKRLGKGVDGQYLGIVGGVLGWMIEHGITPCTSVTRPGAPYEGQQIFEIDYNILRIWDGDIWQSVPTSGVPGTFLNSTSTKSGRKVQSGTFTIGLVSGVVGTTTISFPESFANIPVVVASSGLITGNAQGTYVNVMSTSTAAFNYQAKVNPTSTYTGSVPGFYIATDA